MCSNRGVKVTDARLASLTTHEKFLFAWIISKNTSKTFLGKGRKGASKHEYYFDTHCHKCIIYHTRSYLWILESIQRNGPQNCPRIMVSRRIFSQQLLFCFRAYSNHASILPSNNTLHHFTPVLHDTLSRYVGFLELLHSFPDEWGYP